MSSIRSRLKAREDDSFQEALQFLNNKQYKKALKNVDGILKKNPGHTESVALKALLLYHLKEKSEAKVYAKQAAVQGDSKPVTNHILGIYYRSVQDYQEAAIWFQKAVDNKIANFNVYKDLSCLQAQNHRYVGMVKSRLMTLEKEAGYRCNWTGLAIAHHLNKDYNAAVKTLTKFEELAKDSLSEGDLLEHSQLLLYKAIILNEAGEFQASLNALNQDEKSIFDKLKFDELKAKNLIQLGDLKAASMIYRKLLKRNPDNNSYYYLLEICLGTNVASADVRKRLYQRLAGFYPKSDPPKFIPLTFLEGDKFVEAASDYVLEQLRRGIPSAFVNVKPLYKDVNKAKALGSIVTEFFNKNHTSPTTYVWSGYYLAQHYLELGQLNEALKFANLVIEHTPTLVEPYIVKARVFKHKGEPLDAAKFMDEARKLDLQDKFINSKTTKYYLRANLINEATQTIKLFHRIDDSVDVIEGLHNTECVWFITEEAEAFYRIFKEKMALLKDGDFDADLQQEILENQGLAYKRFQAIDTIFGVFIDEQFDFHSYCPRKGTPASYIEMIRWADNLYHQPMYTRASVGICKILFNIHKKPEDLNPKGLSRQEKKRRDALSISQKSYREDDDVFGERAVEELTMDDLNTIYNRLNKQYIQVNELGFELYCRQYKVIFAAQALINLSKLTNNKHREIGHFLIKLNFDVLSSDKVPDSLKKVVKITLLKNFPETKDLLDDRSQMEAYANQKFLSSLTL
ncbi:N-terminal acetyltransferase NatA subunit [Komagataella phaffii CBS 7435]|uniref:Subunit of the N-terminal acetyltransferase NatA (Nat1p, Ard1p, Nat5p) n=2 Tax=Komagataella phaffii TaxID=460519 RepID=C4QWX7_KOMPG|nr:Subunit of the N-terminal acetyltransferase NatA (Nat1p, Ard1p, Nat5p) [Komagataella phaffii GS115]AOA60940.1 GQ67_02958T0 [Komagataella phaffii]CAH2446544.1 N-terminal acetyltransferase NatA subunit [Komagataella phaffii CBS 7435]AOA65912.1 GQ68_02289T0 [Komagataella phaffii GS115]CAY67750.1 Subunit of the N-terminal acetyltransferase NatA (Nat1p, Ard1p, Nat5p) [Komagataella phaffii GS115]CCA36837.1 N-terminal acetyltransferase NatA subunit [Komagataella phaffii CBS 7435]